MRWRVPQPADTRLGVQSLLGGRSPARCGETAAHPPPRRCLILPISRSGRQPEPARVLGPLPQPGPCAGVRGGLGGQVAPADGPPGAARTAGCGAPAAPGRAGQQAGGCLSVSLSVPAAALQLFPKPALQLFPKPSLSRPPGEMLIPQIHQLWQSLSSPVLIRRRGYCYQHPG